MSEKKWTPEQKRAIDERKRTLLVSAAAGSGKTATLTERIISSLIYDDTADISKMIVVTFTRAAAAELRMRISSALSDAIAKNPENKRLEKQILLLPSAKINTIHGFCSDILRQNASSLGLSPSFRVCEESERNLLLSDIAKTLVEECFFSEDNSVCDGDAFCLLADNLVSARSEGDIEEILISMYEKLASFVDKVAALRGLRDNFLPFTEFFDTVAGKRIRESLFEAFGHYKSVYENNIEKVCAYSGAKFIELHLPAYEDDLSYIKRVLSSLDKGYAETKKALFEHEKAKLGSVRGEAPDEYDEIAKATRTDFWEMHKSVCKRFFGYTDEQLAELQTKLYEFHSTLYLVLSELDRRFRREKIRRGICDYGDLEHYALEILYDGEEISSVAKELRDYYDAIYIDEYQDINPIQHKIFSAIRREDNCFMVGDIKQSIYSFRLADPDIFAEMKKSFSKIEDAGATGEAAIFMSDNFRCDETVVDFTNLVFDALFSVAGESIGYEHADRLKHSKTEPEGYRPVLPTVTIVEQSGESKNITERLDSFDDED
ncbi:MAG: UvrD-helicase domain-containing protein, partial [Clostridia bacterium]|nr:UvrD-helicase domain-containing protein [Clostridia bacterium]